MRIFTAGLISLLYGCVPGPNIIYMNSEVHNSGLRTYTVSDDDDKIKREILEAGENMKIPSPLVERLMAEASQRGLPVKTRDLIDGTEVNIFFPILHGRHEWLERYLTEGYFMKSMRLYDDGKDGTIDGLSNEDRKKFRNIIRASEKVLKSKKPN